MFLRDNMMSSYFSALEVSCKVHINPNLANILHFIAAIVLTHDEFYAHYSNATILYFDCYIIVWLSKSGN